MKYFLIIIIILISFSAYCKEPNDSINKNEFSNQIEKITSQTNEYAFKVLKLENEIESLNKILESYNYRLNLILAFFAVLLTLGTGFSIFGFIRNEKRESQVHKLAIGSFQENRSNVSEARKKENEIFTESQRTLALVNDTLSLATDASRRASKSLENRFRSSINKLEGESRYVIESSKAYDDDKNLTTDKDTCTEIHRIGRKIEGLEENLIMLEDSQIAFKPHCNFIKGTHSYLSEEFKQAIEYLENVVVSQDAENRLKSLSYFWIGYIHNNLGDFNPAISSFKKAREFAIDSRKYELSRIQLETRFFNGENPKPIIEEFKKLLTLFDNDTSEESTLTLAARKTRIQTTLGNIYYQLANQTNDDGNERKCFYSESKNIFKELLNLDETKDVLNQIYSLDNTKKDKSKWIIFGYAESLYQLGDKKELAKEIFKKIIYHLAENEFWNREEKRTKVLAKTTQLICVIRAEEDKITISNTKSQVDSALNSVDKQLTIYSQLQRRNVKGDIFRDDLDKLQSGRI